MTVIEFIDLGNSLFICDKIVTIKDLTPDIGDHKL